MDENVKHDENDSASMSSVKEPDTAEDDDVDEAQMDESASTSMSSVKETDTTEDDDVDEVRIDESVKDGESASASISSVKEMDTTEDDDAVDDDEQTIVQTVYFSTSNKIVHMGTDLNDHYKTNVVDELLKSVEETAFHGSGFTLSRILRLDVQICSYEPFKGSSYIKTPKKLNIKKAIVNVQNRCDRMCFKWAVLSALHPVEKNAFRTSHYIPYQDELNFDGIDFPVRLHQIDQFECQNSEISINVYYYDEYEDRVCPIRVSSKIKKSHIHLLLILDEKNVVEYGGTISNKIAKLLKDRQIRMHYCWIKSLSRLVSSQMSKHAHKKYICDRCLNFFTEEAILCKHMTHCTSEYHIEMPCEDEKWINFQNHEYQLRAPFVIYADTEAFLKPLSQSESVFNKECCTKAYQEHNMYSVGYYFKCEFDDSKSYYRSSGIRHDCINWFVKELQDIAFNAARMLSYNKPMIMTQEDKRKCQDKNAVCFICDQHFEIEETPVRDHCHFTGKFRGVVHSECNLKYRESRTIPVVMHNLSGYDAHLFIKELSTEIAGDISIIPINAEQYISFTKTVWNSTLGTDMREKVKLKFIDSFRFMADSLSKLSSLIPSNKKCILRKVCEKDYSTEQIAMLERKGVFPYDYVDSLERLSDTALPSKEQFKSRLNDEDISKEDYNFACAVWDKFQLETLGEYSDLYLKTDVLLLADVYENFREICLSTYKLDPLHYYTAPGLSFDAMLKYTDIDIELLTDVEMLVFIERGIRGGISQCNMRHVKANNKYMKTEYKPEEESRYLMYLDGELIYIHSFIDEKYSFFMYSIR